MDEHQELVYLEIGASKEDFMNHLQIKLNDENEIVPLNEGLSEYKVTNIMLADEYGIQISNVRDANGIDYLINTKSDERIYFLLYTIENIYSNAIMTVKQDYMISPEDAIQSQREETELYNQRQSSIQVWMWLMVAISLFVFIKMLSGN